MNVQIAGRQWAWAEVDSACQRYLAEHWQDALAPLAYVPIGRRKTCVQAGGNFGVWPWLLSPRFEQVITFEPDDECYDMLVVNVADRPNITAHKLGLSDRDTMASIVPHGKNRGAQHLKFGDGPVACIALDSMRLKSLDLLMLDIEGAEHFALEGARETIKEFNPVIVVEDWRVQPKAYKRAGKPYPGHAKENYGSDATAKEWLHLHGYSSVARIGQDEVYLR